jgi:6-pyruvoyltetrahydropterin/6-carboxytetrahydropterin synthase
MAAPAGGGIDRFKQSPATRDGMSGMYEVTVSGWFAAAYQLRLPDGSLEPLHGHNWKVNVTYGGPELDSMGVLVDFVALRARLDALLASMHDRHLNELPAFAERNPSAEGVARQVAEQMSAAGGDRARLLCAEVEEAPGCVARYRPST